VALAQIIAFLKRIGISANNFGDIMAAITSGDQDLLVTALESCPPDVAVIVSAMLVEDE
jgi:hypothetical protein